MVLWVIAYFCGFFERPDQAATASATPAGPVSSGTAQSPHR